MPKQETKTMLDAASGSHTGDAVTTTTAWGTVTFMGWLTKEEGASFGDCDCTIQGSIDNDAWIDLATFEFSTSETVLSLMIEDGYRYYRAVTGTVADDNYINLVAHCKGPEK